MDLSDASEKIPSDTIGDLQTRSAALTTALPQALFDIGVHLFIYN